MPQGQLLLVVWAARQRRAPRDAYQVRSHVGQEPARLGLVIYLSAADCFQPQRLSLAKALSGKADDIPQLVGELHHPLERLMAQGSLHIGKDHAVPVIY